MTPPLFNPVTAHWRGTLPPVWTLAGPLFLVTLGVLWVSPVAEVWPWVTRLSLIILLSAVTIWQVRGALRAAALALGTATQRPLAPLLYAGAIAATLGCAAATFDIAMGPAPAAPPLATPDPNLTRLGDTLHLDGVITLRTYYAAAHQIEEVGGIKTLTLSSPGGAVHAARGLARLVREHELTTLAIGPCHSACPLVFIAGTQRHLAPDASLGFHQYASQGHDLIGKIVLSDAKSSQAKDAAAFLAAGVDPAFVDRMFDTPHDQLWQPSRAALTAAGLLTP